MATIEDFQKLDIRVGKIIAIEDFPEAKKPSYKLTIDFGKEVGIKKSSVQVVKTYSKEGLKNTLVLGVVKFPTRKIGPLNSEILTLGVPNLQGECVLVVPEREVPVGGILYLLTIFNQ